MTVSFKGWKERVATFEAASDIEAGSVVKVSGNGQVSACSAGDKFAGVVLSCRGGFAAVQLEGYAEISYSGTAPAVGYQLLCADGSGGVKTATIGQSEQAFSKGREHLVAAVDTTAQTAGIIL